MSMNTSEESEYTAHNDSKNTSIAQSILNVILVFIESALTLALRFDPKLRQAAYPLAKTSVVVCIRTYLPHTEVYATFSQRGILLDGKLPAGLSEPDVVINAYSTQLINILLSHDVKQVNKLPMRGPQELTDQVKVFLLQLGLGSFIQGALKNFKSKKSDQSDKSDKVAYTIAQYKEQLDKKEAQVNTLMMKNRELEISRKELKSKQKMLFIAIGVLALIAVVSLIGWIT